MEFSWKRKKTVSLFGCAPLKVRRAAVAGNESYYPECSVAADRRRGKEGETWQPERVPRDGEISSCPPLQLPSRLLLHHLLPGPGMTMITISPFQFALSLSLSSDEEANNKT